MKATADELGSGPGWQGRLLALLLALMLVGLVPLGGREVGAQGGVAETLPATGLDVEVTTIAARPVDRLLRTPLRARRAEQETSRDRSLRVAARTLAMTEDPEAAINRWDWEAGVAMAGLLYAHRQTGDPALLDAVAGWMDARLAEGIGLGHANHATPAWAALMLYEQRPDPRYLAEARRAVEYLRWRAPRTHGSLAHFEDQLWDDTLIVSAPLLARYGALQDCASCLAEAVDEVLAHGRRLQEPVSGRWYHGWDRSDFLAGLQPHMSAAQWARGNGWAALATTEVLQWLPEGHPWQVALRDRLRHQLEGLAVMQDGSGLWHTVVTRKDFYLESSGSAAIAAAMLRASDAGWVDGPQLESVGRTAARAVDALVAEDGTLTRVSTGTGVAPSIEVYNQVPFDAIKAYGQGLYLMMAEAGVR